MEGIFKEELNQEENQIINELIHQQLFYHLVNLTCALIINLSSRDIDLNNIPIQVVQSDEMWIKRNHSYQENLAFSCRCQAFVLLCEECDELRNVIESIEYQLKFTDWGLRFNRRHYIVISVNSSFGGLRDVFNSRVLKYIPYFLVVNIAVTNVTFYTHDFRSNIVELSGDSDLFNIGFPEVFRVATDSFVPYSDAVLAIGSELELCREYAKRYKMEYFLGGIGEYFGTIEFHDNNSYEVINSTGLHDGLLSDKYDTIFGAFLAVPEEYAIYDFTYPSTVYGCTCLVPIPKLAESWFSILKLFTPITWFLFFLTFVLLSVLSRVAIRNEEMGKISFISYSIFIFQPVNSKILKQAKCFFILSLALAVLHQCAFSSRLSTTLIFAEFEGDVSTVKDLAESDLDWGADHPDWLKPLSGDNREVYEIIKHKFYVYNSSEMQELFEKHEHFAFAISPLESRMWTFRDYITPNHINHYKVMSDKLYRQFTYLPMRKHSMFLETFNMFLLNVRETGLFVRWEIMALMSYSQQYENIRALQTGRMSTEALLGLRHIKGILMLLVFGHLVAICIFIYELHKFKEILPRNQQLSYWLNLVYPFCIFLYENLQNS